MTVPPLMNPRSLASHGSLEVETHLDVKLSPLSENNSELPPPDPAIATTGRSLSSISSGLTPTKRANGVLIARLLSSRNARSEIQRSSPSRTLASHSTSGYTFGSGDRSTISEYREPGPRLSSRKRAFRRSWSQLKSTVSDFGQDQVFIAVATAVADTADLRTSNPRPLHDELRGWARRSQKLGIRAAVLRMFTLIVSASEQKYRRADSKCVPLPPFLRSRHWYLRAIPA